MESNRFKEQVLKGIRKIIKRMVKSKIIKNQNHKKEDKLNDSASQKESDVDIMTISQFKYIFFGFVIS